MTIRIAIGATISAVYFCFALAGAEDLPPIYNSEADGAAKPMSAAEAASRFQVPDGFSVSVFASEPDVQNPIGMAWDARGRLWIAENYTYAERSQRFDLSLRDRVLVFEDADADGVADKRTVFTDQVQMLTSVEVGHGGVWLMSPPRLLFLPDADRNDVPDGPPRVVLDGFEVAKENYHNFANGLKWGPDGWLYGRCGGSCPGRIGPPGTATERRVPLEGGIWRYHPHTSHFEVLAHGTTNPWGHDWNQFGDGFFINTVNGHLWQLIPGAHFQRPFTLDPNPYVYELIDMHADHWHFDTGASWTNSRDGAANSHGGGHAHVGMMIYLGDALPDQYRGRLLTFNLHGRRANQERLERRGSGYVARHGRDMLVSADSFFRGMDLSYGPDGAVYAMDWSDTGECHEHTGVHRTSGRIFRFAYSQRGAAPHDLASGDFKSAGRGTGDLRVLSSGQLAELMQHRNEWFVRQARLILAERQPSQAIVRRPSAAVEAVDSAASEDGRTAVESLRDMVRGADAVVAFRALVTLHAMGVVDSDLLRELLLHQDEHLRAWAIRLLTDDWPIDDVFGLRRLREGQAARIAAQCDALLEAFCQTAAYDESGLVRLTLASTLQRMPDAPRAALAARLLARREDANDHNLPLLVWYGLSPLAETDPGALARLACHSQWPKTARLIARRLAEQIDRHPGGVEQLLAGVVNSHEMGTRRNLLAGIADGLKGWSRVAPPNNWAQVVDAVRRDRDEMCMAMIRDLSVLFGDGRALKEVRAIVLDASADMGLRRSALQTLVATNGDEIVDICLPLLADARLNAVAAKGLSRSRDPRAARELIKNYRRFRGPQRPQVIAILVSRPEFAAELLNAIQANKIPAGDLTAFDVRQIRSLDDATLRDRVSALWGEVRETSQARREQIDALKQQLTRRDSASLEPARGRHLFNQTCAKCHRLFGQGETIGPDLTGANRNNLDYLLENIVDPSAVVSKDFCMTVVRTIDGRVLNGLVVSRNSNTLTLQTQTDRTTIRLDDVEQLHQTTQSPMPDGLLDNLAEDQIQDLFAYLMQPAQVPLPGATAEHAEP